MCMKNIYKTFFLYSFAYFFSFHLLFPSFLSVFILLFGPFYLTSLNFITFFFRVWLCNQSGFKLAILLSQPPKC